MTFIGREATCSPSSSRFLDLLRRKILWPDSIMEQKTPCTFGLEQIWSWKQRELSTSRGSFNLRLHCPLISTRQTSNQPLSFSNDQGEYPRVIRLLAYMPQQGLKDRMNLGSRIRKKIYIYIQTNSYHFDLLHKEEEKGDGQERRRVCLLSYLM